MTVLSIANARSGARLDGRTVLVRVDFNVPLDGTEITSDRRIVQALPTLRHLRERGARLVLMSHLGRPSGKGYEAAFSLAPVAIRLSHLLETTVVLGPKEVTGDAAVAASRALEDGGVLLLENVRFAAGETIADKASKNPDKALTADQQATLDAFVASLAELGDDYVNDAFGTCHRKHASMYGLAEAIRLKGGFAAAGFLVEKEVRFLNGAVATPARPFVAILGGAKVSDKLKLIASLLPKVDHLLIGGAMAYTLLAAKGVRVGRSRVEADQVDAMKALLATGGGKILLPTDHVATDDFENGLPVPVDAEALPDSLLGVDIGPKTRTRFAEVIAGAKTVVWNGPMGVFERPVYAAGTRAVADAMAIATSRGATTIVGGGDSATAVETFELEAAMSHISTGGGASLEYLEGRRMPPLEVLDTSTPG